MKNTQESLCDRPPHSALGYQTLEEFAQAGYDKHQDTNETKRIEAKDQQAEQNAPSNAGIRPLPPKQVNRLSSQEDLDSHNYTLQINLV
jgi:hypothetical protein